MLSYVPGRPEAIANPERRVRVVLALAMALTALGCSSIPWDLPAIERADAIEVVDGGDLDFMWHPKKGWGLGYGISKLYASVQNVVGSMVDPAFAARARTSIQEEYARALQAAFPDKRVFCLGRTIREAQADPRSPVCTFHRYVIQLSPDEGPWVGEVMPFRLLPLPMPQQTISGGLWVSEATGDAVVKYSLTSYPLEFEVGFREIEGESPRKGEAHFSEAEAEEAIRRFAAEHGEDVSRQLLDALARSRADQ